MIFAEWIKQSKFETMPARGKTSSPWWAHFRQDEGFTY